MYAVGTYLRERIIHGANIPLGFVPESPGSWLLTLAKRQEHTCFKPAGKRLALFGLKDEYECYAESYVKCFWGLCDHHHKSVDSFATHNQCQVITQQPVPRELRFKAPGIIQSTLLRH